MKIETQKKILKNIIKKFNKDNFIPLKNNFNNKIKIDIKQIEIF